MSKIINADILNIVPQNDDLCELNIQGSLNSESIIVEKDLYVGGDTEIRGTLLVDTLISLNKQFYDEKLMINSDNSVAFDNKYGLILRVPTYGDFELIYNKLTDRYTMDNNNVGEMIISGIESTSHIDNTVYFSSTISDGEMKNDSTFIFNPLSSTLGVKIINIGDNSTNSQNLININNTLLYKLKYYESLNGVLNNNYLYMDNNDDATNLFNFLVHGKNSSQSISILSGINGKKSELILGTNSDLSSVANLRNIVLTYLSDAILDIYTEKYTYGGSENVYKKSSNVILTGIRSYVLERANRFNFYSNTADLLDETDSSNNSFSFNNKTTGQNTNLYLYSKTGVAGNFDENNIIFKNDNNGNTYSWGIKITNNNGIKTDFKIVNNDDGGFIVFDQVNNEVRIPNQKLLIKELALESPNSDSILEITSNNIIDSLSYNKSEIKLINKHLTGTKEWKISSNDNGSINTNLTISHSDIGSVLELQPNGDINIVANVIKNSNVAGMSFDFSGDLDYLMAGNKISYYDDLNVDSFNFKVTRSGDIRLYEKYASTYEYEKFLYNITTHKNLCYMLKSDKYIFYLNKTGNMDQTDGSNNYIDMTNEGKNGMTLQVNNKNITDSEIHYSRLRLYSSGTSGNTYATISVEDDATHISGNFAIQLKDYYNYFNVNHDGSETNFKSNDSGNDIGINITNENVNQFSGSYISVESGFGGKFYMRNTGNQTLAFGESFAPIDNFIIDSANNTETFQSTNDFGYHQMILKNLSTTSGSYCQIELNTSVVGGKNMVIRHNSSGFRLFNTTDSKDVIRSTWGTNKTYLSYISSGSGSNLNYNTGSGEIMYVSSVLADKEGIIDCDINCEEIIQNLSVKKYKRKNDENQPKIFELGIIANHLDTLLTEKNFTDYQKKIFLTYDNNSNLTGIKSNSLTMLLIKEVQRLNIVINENKEQINTLITNQNQMIQLMIDHEWM